jgi:hypothetical protein
MTRWIGLAFAFYIILPATVQAAVDADNETLWFICPIRVTSIFNCQGCAPRKESNATLVVWLNMTAKTIGLDRMPGCPISVNPTSVSWKCVNKSAAGQEGSLDRMTMLYSSTTNTDYGNWQSTTSYEGRCEITDAHAASRRKF